MLLNTAEAVFVITLVFRGANIAFKKISTGLLMTHEI